MKKTIIASLLAAALVLTSITSTLAATYSPNWYQDIQGWHFRGTYNAPIRGTWLCDDAISENSNNIWYLLDSEGNLVTDGLIRDAAGNYYSLETTHNGYYGMLRHQNGTYDGIYLEFDNAHNGRFGAILNEDGIEALRSKYGVVDINITNIVNSKDYSYLSDYSNSSSSDRDSSSGSSSSSKSDSSSNSGNGNSDSGKNNGNTDKEGENSSDNKKSNQTLAEAMELMLNRGTTGWILFTPDSTDRDIPVWTFITSNHEYVKDQWKYINGRLFCFDEDGVMYTGKAPGGQKLLNESYINSKNNEISKKDFGAYVIGGKVVNMREDSTAMDSLTPLDFNQYSYIVSGRKGIITFPEGVMITKANVENAEGGNATVSISKDKRTMTVTAGKETNMASVKIKTWIKDGWGRYQEEVKEGEYHWGLNYMNGHPPFEFIFEEDHTATPSNYSD